MTASLVQPLFDDPLDIVGDIHGEIGALTSLLGRLGYTTDGRHPEGRRLAFVGDLVDRGPDSPAVVELVRRLVQQQRAQCVLGNHELNILLERQKPDNVWFFGHALPPDDPASRRPQVWADQQTRVTMLSFFRSLPLALERPDVRIVHACWDERMIAAARPSASALQLHDEQKAKVGEQIRHRRVSDPSQEKLLGQNENAVKLLTSGPEAKADAPFLTMGKLRNERRVPWWSHYAGPLCVFGHYWRITLPDEVDNEQLFTGIPLNATLGRGDAMCVDYSVGKRFQERTSPGFGSRYVTRLAALRLPERLLVFEDGSTSSLISPG
jgi:hypothetical protein